MISSQLLWSSLLSFGFLWILYDFPILVLYFPMVVCDFVWFPMVVLWFHLAFLRFPKYDFPYGFQWFARVRRWFPVVSFLFSTVSLVTIIALQSKLAEPNRGSQQVCLLMWTPIPYSFVCFICLSSCSM